MGTMSLATRDKPILICTLLTLSLSLIIITIQCTQQCGGGRRQRNLTCVDSKTNEELSSSECNAFKPSENEPCNLQDCEYIHELIALPITLLIEH